MTTAIDVRGVDRTFGRNQVLHDMTFQVPQDAIVGLLGRNGAGKTTIMSIIAGQDRATSGEVLVEGRRPFEDADVLSRIRFIRDTLRYPDDYKLHHVLRIAPEFCPRWNADLAAELVDRFALPSRTVIKKYSRGQTSALGIVLGLASRAPVTLLDEPYLGLDVPSRCVFYEVLLRDYAEAPRTVLLSTHLVAESQNLFDRVVILADGRVVADGDRDEVTAGVVQVAGATSAVARITAGHRVLRTEQIGALTSALVQAAADPDLTAAAQQVGAQITPATLQDLVGAYGGPTGTDRSDRDDQRGAQA